jgi:hypothetical protein
MGRGIKVADNDFWDWYLKPRDGRLAPLKVQAAPNCRSSADRITWERTDLEDITPLSIRLVYWCMDSVKELINQQPTQDEDSQPLPLPDGRGGFDGASNLAQAGRMFMSKEWRQEYLSKRWFTVYWRYPITCLGLLVLVRFIASFSLPVSPI